MSYNKGDIDKWFDYSYLPSQRLIYLGSHDAEMESGEGESGTDCQMAEFFLKAIIHADNISSKPIVVHMNNLGGSWDHGMCIYDAIRASPAHIYGICWSHAFSMGSIIIQSCDSRIIAPHCTFMIHDGSEDINGTCKDVEAWAKNIPKIRQKMYEIYFERIRLAKPRITMRKIEDLCSHDTIFTANEVISYGLGDWILETLRDPYKYYATNTQRAKWQPTMKLGKHEVEEDDIEESQ